MSTTEAPTVRFAEDGNRAFVTITTAMVHPAPNGSPVTDFSEVAEQVDAADVKVGDFMNVGAGMFVRVVEGPCRWRNFTQIWTFSDRSSGEMHRFRAHGRPWVIRNGS